MGMKMLPALTNRVRSSFASSSSVPTAAGMEGITKKTLYKVHDRTRLPRGVNMVTPKTVQGNASSVA
eukprot:4901547-Prorocentrum_lima.AAC.1